MGFLGLDVLAITNLSRQLNGQAGEVRAAASLLGSAITGTEWFGADQQAFVREWETTHRKNLLRAADLLAEASRIAARGADDQDRVSRS